MRALLLALVVSCFAIASAQTCSPVTSAAAAKRLHAAQARALAFEAAPMDSGVPAPVAQLLIDMKSALTEGADSVLACASAADTPTQLQTRLNAFLAKAAPGLPVPKPPAVWDEKAVDDSLKPVRGQYGNEVEGKVKQLSGAPRLIEVTISSDVTCGDDSQLLIYERRDGHWARALRWSTDFVHNPNDVDDAPSAAWGDFFLTEILIPDKTHPTDWRAVVSHGSPWCTSRFSGFGLAVLAPNTDGQARIVWQTNHEYSRGGDSEPSLRATDNTFELRLHADEMSFNEDGFERLVVYRYLVSGDKVTRLEPVAAHARGFVEEWLSMPWEEALAQSDPAQAEKLKAVHTQYEAGYKDTNNYTTWASGPVQACTALNHFQVTMATDRNRIVPGKPGGESSPGPTYYFQLQQHDGYRLGAITTKPDSSCTGPDLMKKP